MIAEIIHKTGFLHPEYHFDFPFSRDSSVTDMIIAVRMIFPF